MSKTHRTEVLVIGGGPGGYAAAYRAADLGLDVTMINADTSPGGVCLHRGCIPSKALLHVAYLLNQSRAADALGVHFGEPKIDIAALRDWKSNVIEKLARGLEELARRRNVTLLRGRAVFIDSHRVHVEGPGDPDHVQFDTCVLATGSLPSPLPGLHVDSARLLNSTSALDLPDIPPRLLVVGGGYIGLELGTVYCALGSRVSLVELTDGLLPGVDRDLVRPVQKRAETRFEHIHLQTRVVDVREDGADLCVTLDGDLGEKEQRFDRVLVCIGRHPNTAGIGLDRTKVEVDAKGFVQVDSQRRTTDPGIFAIGDVAGEPMLAHKASCEGKVAAEALAGRSAVFDARAIPAVVFTDPEITWCGLTETHARRDARQVAVGRFPWVVSGRAATLGRTDGLTKVLLDPATDRILGVGIVGVGAGELISEGVIAVEMGAVAEDVARSIHPHPTLSETLAGAVEVYLGTATDIVPKRRNSAAPPAQ